MGSRNKVPKYNKTEFILFVRKDDQDDYVLIPKKSTLRSEGKSFYSTSAGLNVDLHILQEDYHAFDLGEELEIVIETKVIIKK